MKSEAEIETQIQLLKEQINYLNSELDSTSDIDYARYLTEIISRYMHKIWILEWVLGENDNFLLAD